MMPSTQPALKMDAAPRRTRRFALSRALLVAIGLSVFSPGFFPDAFPQGVNPGIEEPPPPPPLPPTPPERKDEGDQEGTSDESEEPSSESGGGPQDTESSGEGDGTSGEGEENKCPKPEEEDPISPPPSCIKETISLAFAPNDAGLASGALQLYIGAPGSNFGSRSYLDFYGIPYMVLTEVEDLGAISRYTIILGDGSNLTFEIDANAPPVGGYLVGYPVGGAASNLARVTYVDAAGAPSSKAAATYLRYHRDKIG